MSNRDVIDDMILSKIKNNKRVDESLLEKMIGPRNVVFFDCKGNDMYVAVDNWEYPRCVNVMSPNDEVLAKVKIPTSDVTKLEFIVGELTPDENRKAIEILNSRFCTVPCWQSIWCCLEPRDTFNGEDLD